MTTALHKFSLVSACAVATLIASANTDALADSNVHRRHAHGGSLGLGLMVGGPSGLSGKLYTERGPALGFGLGGYHSHHDQHVHGTYAHIDALWHPAVLARSRSVQVPFYLGIGGRVAHHDHNDDAHRTDLGVRVPFGLAMEFTRAPLDVFFELAFDMDVLTTHDHGVDADLSGAFGARYYF